MSEAEAAEVPTALTGVDVPYRVVRTGPAGSAEESAELQGIELGSLLRTIVVRRGEDDYVFVLVPAGRRFDWPKLRSHLGVSRYERYTITPFGASRAWPVIADASIVDRTVVAIGGGARGVNVHFAPADLVRQLDAAVVDVSVVDDRSGPPG